MVKASEKSGVFLVIESGKIIRLFWEMLNMTEQKNFTEGKILAPLLKFAIPVLFALFLQ